jgi:hypothetical protein
VQVSDANSAQIARNRLASQPQKKYIRNKAYFFTESQKVGQPPTMRRNMAFNLITRTDLRSLRYNKLKARWHTIQTMFGKSKALYRLNRRRIRRFWQYIRYAGQTFPLSEMRGLFSWTWGFGHYKDAGLKPCTTRTCTAVSGYATETPETGNHGKCTGLKTGHYKDAGLKPTRCAR